MIKEPENPLKRQPRMGPILLKALYQSFKKPDNSSCSGIFQKQQISLKSQKVCSKTIIKYNNLCRFSTEWPYPVPATFIQILFTPLLGKIITSDACPVPIIGLIHTRQVIEQIEPIYTGQNLNLSCTLNYIHKSPKGTVAQILLQAESEGKIVWKGISEFLSRIGSSISKKKNTIKLFHLKNKS